MMWCDEIIQRTFSGLVSGNVVVICIVGHAVEWQIGPQVLIALRNGTDHFLRRSADEPLITPWEHCLLTIYGAVFFGGVYPKGQAKFLPKVESNSDLADGSLT